MAFTPQNLSAAVALSRVALSPDGSKVVYHVTELTTAGESQKASFWYASDLFSEEDSVQSTQITSGQFNDHHLQWHPDSKTIYFLSDRVKNSGGGTTQIYKLSVTGPGEPSILDSSFKEKKQGIRDFKISPDGKYIAFISAVELSAEDQKKEEEKDDPQVWGDTRSNAHLRVFTISTSETKTLIDSGHVFKFAWSPDSKSLVYCLGTRSAFDAKYEPTTIETISILPGSTPVVRKALKVYSPDDIVWPSSHEIYSLGPYNADFMVDAAAVHRISISGPAGQNGMTNLYAGETEDAIEFQNIGNGEIAVKIASGLGTRIDILDRDGKSFVLYDTKCIESLYCFDVKEVDETYVFACIRNSAPRKEPPAIYVGRAKKNEKLDLKCISSHYPWAASHKLGAVERFDWTGEDGTKLEGVAWFPEGLDSSNVKTPLPTVVVIHGGPYYRDVPSLSPSIYSWASMLSENGYLVILPNYRGSSGRGSKFARAAYLAVGTTEWSDIDRMVDEAVKRGLADQNKLGLGGWSFGGFLSAWGASQTKSKYKCAAMMAGISDWGAMTTESDASHYIENASGASPWFGSKARLAGDPIRFAKDIETAFLILHGQSDVRVPVGQGIGFHRALRAVSKYPNRHVLVTYPRESHGFAEKKHGEDLLKRVLDHYEKWLK